MPTYSYPVPNSTLIKDLKLEEHPEGGFFVQTSILPEQVSSPYADGATRSLATQIYYLLSPASPRGRMHMNKSVTFHTHHAGRALYTLVRPSSTPGQAPEIKHVTMGEALEKGEVRQLVVEGGWWKASEIPPEDLKDGTDEEKVGCLISEVVVPGFSFDDHAFLDQEGLVKLFGGDADAEGVKKLAPYVRPTRD